MPSPKYRKVRKPRVERTDPEKLAFVAQQRCLAWSLDPYGCSGRVEVHHVRIRGGKASAAKTIPLCHGHHTSGPRSFHKLGRKGFERALRLDVAKEADWYHQKYVNYKSGLGEIELPESA